MSQVVLEAVLLTSLAGYIGLFVGFGAMELIAFFMQKSGADSSTFANPAVDENDWIKVLG